MYLNQVSYSVLLYLQKNPMASISEIRANVELQNQKHLSFYETKKAFDTLIESNIIKDFAAEISPQALNLERVSVKLDIGSFNSIKKIEEILDRHNYTRYRSRFISGETRGIYADFEIPFGTQHYIKELCDELTKINCIDDYVFYTDTRRKIQTDINFDYINKETLNWAFNIDDWTNETNVYPSKETKKYNISSGSSEHDAKLIELDLWLLRILSWKPRLKNIEILEKVEEHRKNFNLDPLGRDITTLSRRLNAVKENYIQGYQVILNSDLFNLNSQLIIDVTMSKNKVEEIYKKLLKWPIPFKSNFIETGQGFRWYIYRIPIDVVSGLINFIWNKEPKSMNVINLIPEQKLYWFYPLNYNFEEKNWHKEYTHFFKPIEEPLWISC